MWALIGQACKLCGCGVVSGEDSSNVADSEKGRWRRGTTQPVLWSKKMRLLCGGRPAGFG